jgi:hypothetical protein
MRRRASGLLCLSPYSVLTADISVSPCHGTKPLAQARRQVCPTGNLRRLTSPNESGRRRVSAPGIRRAPSLGDHRAGRARDRPAEDPYPLASPELPSLSALKLRRGGGRPKVQRTIRRAKLSFYQAILRASHGRWEAGSPVMITKTHPAWRRRPAIKRRPAEPARSACSRPAAIVNTSPTPKPRCSPSQVRTISPSSTRPRTS